MEISPIKTERLILRPFDEEDVERIYQLVYANSEVREAWSGYTGSLNDFRQRFAIDPLYRSNDGFGFLAIVLKAESLLIGLMGFQLYHPGDDTTYMIFEDPNDEVGRDPTQREVELTYALGRDYWGRGYATEAGKALIPFGFTQLGITRIVNAVIDHEKHRSRRLMERLGFRIVRNLNPVLMPGGPFEGAPGVIGILERYVGRNGDIPEVHPHAE